MNASVTELEALRTTLVAAVQQIDGLLERRRRGGEPQTGSPCDHPFRYRKMLATPEEPEMFQCGVCREILNDPSRPESMLKTAEGGSR